MKTINQPNINIAIADDHALVREGIVEILSSFNRYNVTIKAGDGNELIHAIEKSDVRPEICILDINMPNKNGWDTLCEIKQKWCYLKVLILTSLTENDVVSRIMRSGGNGYLCKSCNSHELNLALQKIENVGYYYPDSKTKLLFDNINRTKPSLTNKELIFLSHCYEDLCYKEIACVMHVSVRTVEGYRDSLFEKLNVKTRLGLAKYAIKNGFVSL